MASNSRNSPEHNIVVLYEHTDVRVLLSSHHRSEQFCKGILTVFEKHGITILEWKPYPDSLFDDDSDSKTLETDWEDLSTSAVGYTNSSESVEIRAAEKRRRMMTSVEVADIASFKKANKGKREAITFSMKDGRTLPAFYFGKYEYHSMISALDKHVKFKQSHRDSSLYLAMDPKVDALQKSFKELQLYDDKGDIVTKFFADPYTVTMDGFSRVTNVFKDYVLHPYHTGKTALTVTEEEMAEFLNESLPSLSQFHCNQHVHDTTTELPPSSCININHQDDTGFEVITCLELPARPFIERTGEPLSMADWNEHLSSDGSIKNWPGIKEKIFKGGIDPALRCEVWKFLLGYSNPNSSLKERESKRKQRVDDYYRYKLQWKSFTKEQEDHFCAYRDRKNLVEKDVGRTDRNHPFYSGEGNQHLQTLNDILMTYCMYNFDLGYVQGMSDLLSPLLVVNQNEADVFWCFAGFIDRVGTNFDLDQQGMKTQLEQLRVLLHYSDPQFFDYLENHESGNLYFFFRWLLIIFKREFTFESIMRLWEILWTDLPCKNFHLILCLAILDPEKDTIVGNNFGLTEILKHVNDMTLKINLEESLGRAEAIYWQFANCPRLPNEVREILGLKLLSPSQVSPPIKCTTTSTTSVGGGGGANLKAAQSVDSNATTNAISERQNSPVSEASNSKVSPTSDVDCRRVSPLRDNGGAETRDKGKKYQELNKSNSSGSSVDANSIEVLNDDAELERRFDISFTLFT